MSSSSYYFAIVGHQDNPIFEMEFVSSNREQKVSFERKNYPKLKEFQDNLILAVVDFYWILGSLFAILFNLKLSPPINSPINRFSAIEYFNIFEFEILASETLVLLKFVAWDSFSPSIKSLTEFYSIFTERRSQTS